MLPIVDPRNATKAAARPVVPLPVKIVVPKPVSPFAVACRSVVRWHAQVLVEVGHNRMHRKAPDTPLARRASPAATRADSLTSTGTYRRSMPASRNADSSSRVFSRRTGAELDEGVVAPVSAAISGGGDRPQDGAAPPASGSTPGSSVILLEQQRAALRVGVEPFRRQRLRRGGEPGQGIGPQGGGTVVGRQAVLDGRHQVKIPSVLTSLSVGGTPPGGGRAGRLARVAGRSTSCSAWR